MSTVIQLGLWQRFVLALRGIVLAIREWYRRPVVRAETDEEQDARQW